jgi:xylulokinase
MAGDALLVGIDLGTSHIKAIAFTLTGQIAAQASAPTPTVYPQPGWAHHDPAALWTQTAAALRDVTAPIDNPARIAAVAVASVGEAGVPLDATGAPTHDAIAWFDTRTQEQAEQLRQRLGAEAIFRRTGMSLQPIFTLCKILWIQQHAPDAYARTVTWLNAADYLTFRLCGVAASEYSLASRTLMLDIHGLRWEKALVQEAGIDPALLPPLLPSGTKLGTVLPAVAAETGLPAHAVITTGGHDHVCGALALGVTRPGAVLDSLGTAEAIFLATNEVLQDAAVGARGYAQGVHVSGGYYVLGGLYTSSACIEWFRETQANALDYAELECEGSAIPPGSLGVHFLPHLRTANPGYDDPRSRAVFAGVTFDAKRGALYRAVLEGLAYEARYSLDSLLPYLPGTHVEHVVATGGGTRNQLLMRIKASVYNRPLRVVSIDEATALGAAMLAGLGAGVYTDVAGAVRSIRYTTTVVEPEPATADFYARSFEQVYRALYPSVRDLHHAIGRLGD